MVKGTEVYSMVSDSVSTKDFVPLTTNSSNELNNLLPICIIEYRWGCTLNKRTLLWEFRFRNFSDSSGAVGFLKTPVYYYFWTSVANHLLSYVHWLYIKKLPHFIICISYTFSSILEFLLMIPKTTTDRTEQMLYIMLRKWKRGSKHKPTHWVNYL